MRLFRYLSKVAAALIAVCGLMLISCEHLSTEMSLSVNKTTVGSDAGQQWVSVTCDGNWTLSLYSDDGDVDWARLNATSGVGDRQNVRLTYDANTSEHSRELRLILTSGNKSVYTSFIQYSENENFYPGSSSTISADPTKQSWMELLAMNDSSLGYYAHQFKKDGTVYRNFSYGWSQSDRVAVWVAYPLSKFYMNGSIGRTNAWSLDPILGQNSSAPFGGYGGGGYVRGHQLPSADRQCSYEANAQTFYGTNLTPQIYDHNGGIWLSLENKVREIARGSDTTYVVTGVVIRSSSKKTRDSYDNSMTVPDAYFKALLYYNKYSTVRAIIVDDLVVCLRNLGLHHKIFKNQTVLNLGNTKHSMPYSVFLLH